MTPTQLPLVLPADRVATPPLPPLDQLLGAPRDAAPRATVAVAALETPLGPMLAGAVDAGVCLLEFVDDGAVEAQLRDLAQHLRATLRPAASPHLGRLADELRRYFAGELRAFTGPLAPRGTPFQERVWAALRTIPYGATRSYAEQARQIGAPTATRAVARANGANRIAVVIPCHRVIGADGTLTGYAGGLWRKRWLLDFERRAG